MDKNTQRNVFANISAKTQILIQIQALWRKCWLKTDAEPLVWVCSTTSSTKVVASSTKVLH